MRKILLFSGLVCLLGLVLIQPVLADNISKETSWGRIKAMYGQEDKSQAVAAMPWWWYINLDIWGRAMKDVGKTTGQDCKPWASQVVKDVTGFSLPSTQSNWIYLNSGHITMIVDGNRVGGGTIESGIGFGNIIQMHILYKKADGKIVSLPHTAFFYEYVPGGMNWIDCNFVSTGKVDVHFVSWDWFRNRVGTRYSIYQATK